MSRLGWFECLVLLAFWLGGLTAFLIGGMRWLGWVTQAFVWTVFVWLVHRLYVEFRDELVEEWERDKAFRQWSYRQNKLKGME